MGETHSVPGSELSGLSISDNSLSPPNQPLPPPPNHSDPPTDPNNTQRRNDDHSEDNDDSTENSANTAQPSGFIQPNGLTPQQPRVDDETKPPVIKDCLNCKFKTAYHIKCKHCPKVLCFSCTLLPRENFLYFFLTNSQYRCTDCCISDLIVRKKNLDVHFEKLDNEIELIQNCEGSKNVNVHLPLRPNQGSPESPSIADKSEQNRFRQVSQTTSQNTSSSSATSSPILPLPLASPPSSPLLIP